MGVLDPAKYGMTVPIQVRVYCPHCWETFSPEIALWIAQHPDLLGDPRLGRDQPRRFLPTRFNLAGAALDERGFACHGLACPKCHLGIPRALFEMPPFFLSILGAPASGKSYLLASMTWQLRRELAQRFALGFDDADAALNHRLHEYESLQFLNPNQDALVAIEKTQTHGDLYDTVLYGDQAVNYPRPFVFTITPLAHHPSASSAVSVSRALCLYDNAGESFLPGTDTATNPVTRHLALSEALLFLFDPTQDMRFRHACAGKSRDPQMIERSKQLDREHPVRQETILSEAAQRVRRYSGLAQQERHDRPLIVVVTKFDAWSALLDGAGLPSPWVPAASGQLCGIKMPVLEEVSDRVRSLLSRHSPEIVATAEGFAKEVIYIPVSATGCSPVVDPATGAFGFRPREIRPQWAEVPLLYAMARWMPGLVYRTRSKRPAVARRADGPRPTQMPSPPPSSVRDAY